MLGVVGDSGVAGRRVKPAAVTSSQSGQKSVSPGRAAIRRGGPANGGASAINDAPSLKCGDLRCAVCQDMGLNFRGVLAGADGEGIGTNLGERDCGSILGMNDG